MPMCNIPFLIWGNEVLCLFLLGFFKINKATRPNVQYNIKCGFGQCGSVGCPVHQKVPGSIPGWGL